MFKLCCKISFAVTILPFSIHFSILFGFLGSAPNKGKSFLNRLEVLAVALLPATTHYSDGGRKVG